MKYQVKWREDGEWKVREFADETEARAFCELIRDCEDPDAYVEEAK